MHCATFVAGLMTLLSASAVAAQTCGQNIFPVGYQCGAGMKNGDRVYDPSCQNILVCHDGTMRLNNPCAPGHCAWRDDAHSAFCVGNQGAAGEEDVASGTDNAAVLEPGCGLAIDAGQQCPTILKEGGRLCDKSCKNIVMCHNGVMETDKSCNLGTCMSRNHSTFGEGAFCSKPRDETDGPIENPSCGFTQEVGQNCSKLIQANGQLCDKSCKNVLTCRNGVMELHAPCESGGCISDPDKLLGKAVKCAEKKSASAAEDPELQTQIVPQFCGPVGVIGDRCGALIKEGWRVCGQHCSNIVECRNGRIQLSRKCAPSTCAVNNGYNVGEAAFCAGDLSPQSEDADYVDDDGIEHGDETTKKSAAECGPSHGPVGSPCGAQMEGQTFCDPGCKDILICHDSVAQVNNYCGGSCNFNPDVHAAFCV